LVATFQNVMAPSLLYLRINKGIVINWDSTRNVMKAVLIGIRCYVI
jgi:hypothetical protein